MPLAPSFAAAPAVVSALVLALTGGPSWLARPPAKPAPIFAGAAAGGTAEGALALALPPGGAVKLPTATFLMGSTPREMQAAIVRCERETFGHQCAELAHFFRAEGHAHPVTVSGFWLDRTEVTVAAYDRCAAAGRCAASGVRRGDPRFDAPALPVTHVRWEDAATYCEAVGGRLPTEAEWERAARGPERRTYPWGALYGARRSNHGSFGPDPTDERDGHRGPAPVGSYPSGRTPDGVLDLAGNVAEWVADLYVVDEQGYGYPETEEHDPRGPAQGGAGVHVVRGGSFQDGAPWLRAAARMTTVAQRDPTIGFRCAYDREPR